MQSPFDAYLLYRSKTLALRMDKHCENAMKVAQYLEKHPKVGSAVYSCMKVYSLHIYYKEGGEGIPSCSE